MKNPESLGEFERFEVALPRALYGRFRERAQANNTRVAEEIRKAVGIRQFFEDVRDGDDDQNPLKVWVNKEDAQGILDLNKLDVQVSSDELASDGTEVNISITLPASTLATLEKRTYMEGFYDKQSYLIASMMLYELFSPPDDES